MGMNLPGMQEILAEIEVDTSEADGLFHLLDVDDTGSIDAEEWITGFIRLKGPAKALELAMMAQDAQKTKEKMLKHHQMLQLNIAWMCDVLTLLAQNRALPDGSS